MKKLLLLIVLFTFNFGNAQDYLEGKSLYCRSKNPEAMRLFDIGIETLYLNHSLNKKYLESTAIAFYKAYKTDSTFCDAAFFTGYTLRLLNQKGAFGYYYTADSIYNRSIEFKINLATSAIRIGSEKSILLARDKYSEIIKYFPESPEGYYGYATLSPMFGEIDKGLENIMIAINKYQIKNGKVENDAYFIYAVLLSMNKKYEEALKYFDKSFSAYHKEDNFKIYYSLSLLKVSEKTKDEQMKKKALKFYNKIDHKDTIDEEVQKLFVF